MALAGARATFAEGRTGASKASESVSVVPVASVRSRALGGRRTRASLRSLPSRERLLGSSAALPSPRSTSSLWFVETLGLRPPDALGRRTPPLLVPAVGGGGAGVVVGGGDVAAVGTVGGRGESIDVPRAGVEAVEGVVVEALGVTPLAPKEGVDCIAAVWVEVGRVARFIADSAAGPPIVKSR
jgi:hypothetical protein